MVEKLNNKAPAAKQIWTHVVTGVSVLVIAIDQESLVAYCVLYNKDTGKTMPPRVAIPVTKLMNWGNRGFAYIEDRKGSLPKLGDVEKYPWYNARNVNLGAE